MESDMSLTASAPLRQIGFGNCGSVWGTLKRNAHNNASVDINVDMIIKREDASPGRDIKNETLVQSQAFRAASTLQLTSIPQCFGLVASDDKRWQQLLPLLPSGLKACRAMIAEKINPVSTQAQLLLIDKYCPAPHREALRRSIQARDGESEHCLVRLYLGRRRQVYAHREQHRPRPQFFSLRNYPLHADQAQDLGLPCTQYARAMAEALATLHWQVRTSGNDVEFVLGARRGGEGDADMPLEEHAVWMLDFDCSRPIEADDSGLESIARAFWRNDPYFPRPGSALDQGRELWDIFAAEYRRVGMEAARAYRRDGEDVESLCALVEGALERIEETKGKWMAGAHF
ncbi:hypothetical protein H634G_03889 [Metarhizium anisopliae BRIP 53293]|uniref:DUF3669 domain-containing protein n=1 Tax=Metarhizium anisopliae BRIP 53293 TaxID=1291518 RepID=A0A0D9P7E1_METAN|nr:hypothetical protein H634G_03889 [Metarhizium anisopliae BRIP 53293]